MSMLLDAVQRQRASQQNQDPALAVMLPRSAPKRQLPWAWLMPPTALVLAATAGWYVAQQQTAAVATTSAPMVDEVSLKQLGPRVSMPMPIGRAMPQQSQQQQSQQQQPLLTVRADENGQLQLTQTAAPDQPMAAINPTPGRAQTSRAEIPEVSAEPMPQDVDPQLLAALEQAFADVEGGEPELSQQEKQLQQQLQQAQLSVDASEAASAEQAAGQGESGDSSDIASNPDGQYQQAQESLDGLSEQQQLALEQALAKAGMAPSPQVPLEPAQIPKLGQLPWSFQKRLPDLEVTAHVYASEAEKRWLRANGRELQEGDEAAPGLRVKEILPNEIILEMDNQAFRIPALGSI